MSHTNLYKWKEKFHQDVLNFSILKIFVKNVWIFIDIKRWSLFGCVSVVYFIYYLNKCERVH